MEPDLFKLLGGHHEYIMSMGNTSLEAKHFDDSGLFGVSEGFVKFFIVLRKLTIFFDKKLGRVMGLQAKYRNSMTGKIVEGARHLESFNSPDIEKKEYECEEGEYFTKFNIAFIDNISYIKFTTTNGKEIGFGDPNSKENKTIKINKGPPRIIQSLYGTYTSNGLCTLGFCYVSKKDFLFLNIIGYLRLRHLLKTSETEKKKIVNKDYFNKLQKKYQILLKLCLLPDNQFSVVLKYFL